MSGISDETWQRKLFHFNACCPVTPSFSWSFVCHSVHVVPEDKNVTPLEILLTVADTSREAKDILDFYYWKILLLRLTFQPIKVTLIRMFTWIFLNHHFLLLYLPLLICSIRLYIHLYHLITFFWYIFCLLVFTNPFVYCSHWSTGLPLLLFLLFSAFRPSSKYTFHISYKHPWQQQSLIRLRNSPLRARACQLTAGLISTCRRQKWKIIQPV